MGGLGTCPSRRVTPADGTRPVLTISVLQWPQEPRPRAQRNVPEASCQSPCPQALYYRAMGTVTSMVAVYILPKGAER